MNANGLLDGQEWAIPPGGLWQARLDRMGRAHVIGEELAKHPGHGPRYGEPERDGGFGSDSFVFIEKGDGNPRDGWCRRWLSRPWQSFDLACRAATTHERLFIASKRQEQIQ